MLHGSVHVLKIISMTCFMIIVLFNICILFHATTSSPIYVILSFFLSFLRRDCLSLHRIFSVNVPIRTMVHCISIPANDTNGACSDPENVSPPVCFEPWTSSTISRCTNNCSTTVLILCNLNVQTESSDNCLLFKEHETSKRNWN